MKTTGAPTELTAPTPTPYTPKELRKRFLDRLRAIAGEWAASDKTPLAIAEGAMFSMLAELDGEGDGTLPPFQLIAEPDQSDQGYHEARNERWVAYGTHINRGHTLHNEWHAEGGAR